jgi:integrase
MAIGRGTLYRRNGQWVINFTVNGTRERRTIGPNRRMAERALQKLMTEAVEGRYFKKRDLGRLPFSEFGQLYLDRVVPHMKSARTERTRVLSWMKHFGSRPLGQITRAEIEEWQRQSRMRVRPATSNRLLGRLRRIFNVAVNWDLLEESPMKNFKMLAENNARHRFLSVEECDRLLRACISPRVRAVVEIALHTGMRLGEILGLCWQDVDFSTGLILIRHSKNGHSRHIPMDSAIVALLKTYPHHQSSDVVFANANGQQFKGVREGFTNACKRARFSDLHFHDLRHTFASQWVMASGDLYLLRDVLGHQAITMTQRYAHLSPQFKRSAVNLLDKIFTSSPTPLSAPSETIPGTIPVTPASQATLSAQMPVAQSATDAVLP